MVQPRVARPHRVLVTTEQRQSLADEGLQGLQRLRARDGPGKAGQPAGVVCEARLDERNHLARDGIGLEDGARRHDTRAGSAKGLAVVGVEVPLATDRLITLHQDVMPLALLAIEILHAQRLAAFGMRRELGNAAEEVAVFVDIQRQAVGCGHGLDRLQHAPVARGGHHQAGRLQAQDVDLQLRRQAAGVAWGVQSRVVQRAAGGLQRQREVAHRRQEHHRARLARPHMGRLLGHLGHPDGVAPSSKPSKADASRSSWSPSTTIRDRRSAMRHLLAPAGVGAVLHVGPVLRPTTPPAHGQAAARAGLAGQGGLIAAKAGVAQRHRKSSWAARAFMPSSPRRCTSPRLPPAWHRTAGSRLLCLQACPGRERS